MIQDFSFSWNGRNWQGYFNAISNQTIIAHFEDEPIRDVLGQTVAFSKTEGSISFSTKADAQLEMYAAVQKGMEARLGKSLQHFLN